MSLGSMSRGGSRFKLSVGSVDPNTERFDPIAPRPDPKRRAAQKGEMKSEVIGWIHH